MTKRAQAMQIFETMKGHTRNEIVAEIAKELSVTLQNAGTYYYHCTKGATPKKAANPKVVTVVSDKKVNKMTSNTKPREHYTICIPEIVDGVKVVGYTGSYMNKSDAVQDLKKDQVLVRGLPEIGMPFSELKTLKI